MVAVPSASLNLVALQTLDYACSIAPTAFAIHVTDDPDAIARRLACCANIQLVVVASPYRLLVQPLLAYLDDLDRTDMPGTLTVILPEFMPVYWQEWLLHNQRGFYLNTALFFRQGTVSTSAAYHFLREPHPPRPRR